MLSIRLFLTVMQLAYLIFAPFAVEKHYIPVNILLFFLDVLKEKVVEWAVVNITAFYTERFIVSFTQ